MMFQKTDRVETEIMRSGDRSSSEEESRRRGDESDEVTREWADETEEKLNHVLSLSIPLCIFLLHKQCAAPKITST